MSFRKVIPIGLLLLAIGFGIRYLLPVLLPFLLAALLALAAEPLVGFFQHKAKLPRAVATGIGVTMTLMLLALLIMVLVALLLRQLRALSGVLPDIEETAVQGLSLLEQWMLGLIRNAPQSIHGALAHSVQGLFSDGTAILDRVTTWLLGLASGILTQLPNSALGLFTWLLASFMLSAKLPAIGKWIIARLPPAWNEEYLPMLQHTKKTVFGWLKAQLKLMAVTALVLSAGFFILQISYAPIWAVLIALVDALPVLGSGMVLVPWSLVCFLQGDSVRGIGLLGVYAAAALLRSILEPRMIGKQLGLDPLVTLLAMYAGYQLFGFGGMILSPLLAVIVAQIISAKKENKAS